MAAATIKDNKDIITEDITTTKIPDMTPKAEAVRPRAEKKMTVRYRSQEDFTLTGDGGGDTPRKSSPGCFIKGFYVG